MHQYTKSNVEKKVVRIVFVSRINISVRYAKYRSKGHSSFMNLEEGYKELLVYSLH